MISDHFRFHALTRTNMTGQPAPEDRLECFKVAFSLNQRD